MRRIPVAAEPRARLIPLVERLVWEIVLWGVTQSIAVFGLVSLRLLAWIAWIILPNIKSRRDKGASAA
jgi:hypothetical protein